MGSDGADGGGLDGVGVSIHAPAWGATATGLQPGPIIQVSIHAPAWGATGAVDLQVAPDGVSIHAPAWGATAWPCAGATRASFQFTLPHGERRWTDKR